jgi:hypothetical protein
MKNAPAVCSHDPCDRLWHHQYGDHPLEWGDPTAPEVVTLPGLAQILANSPALIPSLLYVENAASDQVLVGQAVRDRGLDVAQDPRFPEL